MRAREAEDIADQPGATPEQKATAERLRASADKCLDNLQLGSKLQSRALDAEEIASQPGATPEEKATAERLRASADKQIEYLGHSTSSEIIILWANSLASDATQEDIDAYNRAKSKHQNVSAGMRAKSKFRPYHNVHMIKMKTGNSFRAVVTVDRETRNGPCTFVKTGQDPKDAIEKSARDADVIYLKLFRKHHDDRPFFDVEHPLALPLNFPLELADLHRRSMNAEDPALAHFKERPSAS